MVSPGGSVSPWLFSRIAPAVAFFVNLLVLAGGLTPSSGFMNQDVWTSTDGVNSWRQAPGTPWSGRNLATLAPVYLPSPRLYFIGGESANAQTQFKDVWWTSDPTIGNWTLCANLPTPSQLHVAPAAAALDTGRLAVWTDRLYISNVEVTSWTEVPSVQTFPNRFGPALVNANGNLLIMGGWVSSPGTYLNDVWLTVDGGTSWLQVAASGGFDPRRSSIAVSNGRAVILGIGFNNSTGSNQTIAKSIWVGWF